MVNDVGSTTQYISGAEWGGGYFMCRPPASKSLLPYPPIKNSLNATHIFYRNNCPNPVDLISYWRLVYYRHPIP